jgi:hypothetical protein
MNLQDKSHKPSLPPSSPPSLPPGQDANTDNETVGKEASQKRDILPKLHHVSDHAPDFMKANGINGLMSEECFASFHPSTNAIHRERKA